MTSLARKTALLAGAMALSFAAAAFAAPAAAPAAPADPAPRIERHVIMMRGGPGGHGGPMMGHGMMGGPDRPAMDPAKRAQHLRDVLQLRSDQETALQAFLEATRPPEGPPMAMGGPDDDDDDAPDMPATTPERLDQHLKMMNDHMAACQKRIAAIKTFYGQLTPAQRKAFDALHLDRPMGGGMGGRMMMMRHGGPMMDAPPPVDADAHDHH